ncbi:HIT domain protein [Paraphysoderma sedebokerense]|nr:HIT domain protein [Paraphysoderma sedebokerense]
MASSCIFCKIIRKEIPSLKLFENELTYAFLDIGPLSLGHALVIPKAHGEFLHDIPDENLADLMPVTKKVVKALQEVTGMKDYNILQNNGRAAHQVVPHAHWHIIPKRGEDGLGITWNTKTFDNNQLKELADKLVSKM